MACIFFKDPVRAESYNFAAGPAMLPSAVLEQIRQELPDWQGSGQSILEQPFTSDAFQALMARTEADLRQLLAIPPHYQVLFLQGGASAQFALLPLNLLAPGQHADYLDSGHWSRKAIAEARRHAPVNIIASGSDTGFQAIPARHQWRLDPGAGYCHVTSNETANGLQLQHFPELSVPLVADMTSDLLTRPLPVERFGLIYASTQKNLGVAGLCLVIIRNDLLKPARAGLPSPFSYDLQVRQQSRLNTPPTFALYCLGLMLRWIRDQGGLERMAAASLEKSARLYDLIDSSQLYICRQRMDDRSRINLCVQLCDERLLEAFLAQAEGEGLYHLRGHGAVGGIRASLYNAMPMAGVERLRAFMAEFERRHG